MHISKNINNYYQIGQLWCVAYFFWGGVPHCMSLTNSGQGTFFIKKKVKQVCKYALSHQALNF